MCSMYLIVRGDPPDRSSITFSPGSSFSYPCNLPKAARGFDDPGTSSCVSIIVTENLRSRLLDVQEAVNGLVVVA